MAYMDIIGLVYYVSELDISIYFVWRGMWMYCKVWKASDARGRTDNSLSLSITFIVAAFSHLY